MNDTIQNRIKMGMPAIESQIEEHKEKIANPRKSRHLLAGRVSVYMKAHDRSIIEEDEEYSSYDDETGSAFSDEEDENEWEIIENAIIWMLLFEC